tara:strand:- start:818 stop:2014 length:1197 start_codon:yes stop_codon:yes gene_type:complete
MAISEINDKSLAASAVTATKLATSAVDLTSNKVTGILPAANTVANLSPGNNLVINGAMQISQRATSVTGLGANQSTCQTLDRWKFYSASNGRLTMSQTADGPSGFANCIKLDCTTADTSIAASEYLFLAYNVEGQDVQQIKKGTSDAELITVSFYVKANAAFTFGVELYDLDNNRQITKLFATTTGWVKHSITFPADTTGAFGDDNAASLALSFWLHAGSDRTSGTLNTSAWASNVNANRVPGIGSFYSSTDNEFFITGVQMEVGTVATPFDHRSYGQELALCQRYYEKTYDQGDFPGTATMFGAIKIGGSNVSATTSYISGGGNTFKVTKRARPTLVVYDPDGGTTNQCQRWQLGVGNYNNQASVSADISQTNFLQYSAGGNSASGVIYHYTADAEL